jgi:hypothetical protein
MAKWRKRKIKGVTSMDKMQYTFQKISEEKTAGHIKKEYIMYGKNGKVKRHLTLTANEPSQEAIRATVDKICELF